MAWSTPVQPISGTVITVAWATSTIVDNLNWLRALTGGGDPSAANRVIRSTSTSTTVWGQLNTDSLEDGAITAAKITDNTITENKIANATIIESKLASSLTAKLVPSGLIAAFRTAAAIPSGWSRFTDGDGRLLVGAGTTFSQTFTENTPVGSTWSIGPTTADATGSNAFLAASAATNNSSGATNVTTSGHSHTLSGGGSWAPVARVVVYAIKS